MKKYLLFSLLVVVLVLGAFAGELAANRPPDFCVKNPSHWSCQTGTTTTTEPPPVDKLSWSPPGYPDYPGYTHVTLNDNGNLCPAPYTAGTFPNNQYWICVFPGDLDVVLHLNHRQMPLGYLQGMVFTGGRNLVLIGGTVTGLLPSDGNTYDLHNHEAMVFHNQTGTTHIEGVLVDGFFIRGIAIDPRRCCPEPLPVVESARYQFQNLRFEGLSMWKHNMAHFHMDTIVTQAPAVTAHMLDNISIYVDRLTSDYDHAGMATFAPLDESGNPHVPRMVFHRRANFHAINNQCPGPLPYGGYAWFHTRLTTRLTLDDVWMTTGSGRGTNNAVDCPEQSPAQFDMRRSFFLFDENNMGVPWDGSFLQTGTGMAQGDTLTILDPAVNHVYAVDGTSPGFVTYGTPPEGDFVPVGSVGAGYVSPGYER